VSQHQLRGTQTKVKHGILQKYINKWGLIIFSGLRSILARIPIDQRQNYRVKFVYIDCFSFEGRYSDEDGVVPVYGSPILGIKALEGVKAYAEQQMEGFELEIITILFEKEKRTHRSLVENLNEAGYRDKLKFDLTDFIKLKSGQIAVIQDDWNNHVTSLLDLTEQDYTWSFYFLDTYGQSGIPLKSVSKIIKQTHADVIINFPYLDVQRKSGPASRNDPQQEKHNAYIDAMYGDNDWRVISQQHYSTVVAPDPDQLEQKLVDKYQQTLQLQDKELAIKVIRLKFEDKERTMYYLFLTTHDPTGALELNEILDGAEFQEFKLREEQRGIDKGGQLSLFSPDQLPDRPSMLDPDLDLLADEIYSICKGESITYREILRRLANTPYYHSHVKKAMTKLKKKRLATYSDLRNSEYVVFS
jgi:three-Cys-motif partner protein